MKKIIMVFGLCIIVLNTAFANSEPSNNDVGKFVEVVCGDSADYAKQVMHKRQTGVTLVDAIKNFNKKDTPDSPRDKFYKTIIYNAYKEPKFLSEEQITASENEYSNKVYMICSDSFLKELSN